MLRIKKLDIFICKQFGMLFLGTFFICLFVLMMQFLWRYVDELVGKGLTIEVLAQFFWWMGLMMVPQALPLAILLSSLITFGNLGESSELTAIKSAGISLTRTFSSLVVVSCFISATSFVFQNNIGPYSTIKLSQLLVSMKQKNPELEIPEGVFYDGIPNSNIYVQKKDVKTGKFYGIMIYRMSNSYEDSEIILADSGMLQTTAEKQHLLLTLWNGEWFSNQAQEVGRDAAAPFRRETFLEKKTLIDFNGDFDMTDAALFSGDARGKGLAKLYRDLDSLQHNNDSIGRVFYNEVQMSYYNTSGLSRTDTLAAIKEAGKKTFNVDSAFARLNNDGKRSVLGIARSQVQAVDADLEFKAMVTEDANRMIRQHKIEMYKKFVLSLSCLIFFFIGAPLGTIIRKGGLGIPVIVSVLVFIVYYILDNSGYQMARRGIWAIWFGELLATMVLVPLAVFVTYKANKDSAVFNFDAYRNLLMNLLGMRQKRNIMAKEVIINEPDYGRDAELLSEVTERAQAYAEAHRLKTAPNVKRVFFEYQADNEMEEINRLLETAIDDLGNTRDKTILNLLNEYPIMSVKAHTRPFNRQWLNTAAAILVPVGLVLYIRMWRFRLRLLKDLRVVVHNNNQIIAQIGKL
ncbi:LptF/LptG family permease [Prevotella sp. oral taxon 317]|uniref:LptF/LptG family permease n=1 Tax=Prevotella sp. oral taxon 317 TaxID=652721 RepID=UPI0001C40177|nr:LptF/LptG family permease [Prevotella sp. oral taxon 317]EFC67341.1 permease, YjgP/YjgQ family [Prevotella sp. oral taxon 317 str. F0108]